MLDSSYKINDILMEWIPYSQFTNVKETGFGIIYQAIWLDGSIIGNTYYQRLQKVKRFRKEEMEGRRSNETVILKKFKNPQDIKQVFFKWGKYFNIHIIYLMF